MSTQIGANTRHQPITIRRVWHYLFLLTLVLAMTVPAAILLTPTPVEAVTYPYITPPLLFEPANGTITNDNTVTLEFDGSVVYGGWDDYNDSLGLGDRYQVDNNSDFSSPILDDIPAISIVTTPPLADGTYYWRVQAIGWAHRDQFDQVYLHSDWVTYSFTIDTVPPAVPGLVSPAYGSVTTDTTPTLDWNAASGALSYEWQIANNANFSPVYSSGTTVSTDYTFPSPIPNDLYYWRVRAIDAAGNISGWSTVWSLLIVPIPTTLTVSPVNSYYGGTVNLSATLTITSSSSPVSGYSIAFTLNGTSVGSAIANASGVATLSGVSLNGIPAGTYPAGIGASFAGNSGFSVSSGTAQLYIRNAVPAGSPPPAVPASSHVSIALTVGGLAGAIIFFALRKRRAHSKLSQI